MQRSFGTEISGNRRGSQELSTNQRAAIIAALDTGKSKTEVAQDYHVNLRTVYNTVKRFQLHNTTASRPRNGRPRRIRPREERRLLRVIKKDPKIEYNALIQQNNIQASRITLRRVFKEYNIRKWISVKRPLLSDNIAKKRLQFALKWPISTGYRSSIQMNAHISPDLAFSGAIPSAIALRGGIGL